MKRDKTGKFTQTWDGESKRAVKLSLTGAVWQLLEQQSRQLGISRSELVERYARHLHCHCCAGSPEPEGDRQLPQTSHPQPTDAHDDPHANERQWLEAVLDLLPTPLILVEPEHKRVTFSNRAANAIAGVDLVEDVGSAYNEDYHCRDTTGNMIPPEELPSVRAARGEKITEFELSWHTPVGDFPLLVYADTIPAMHDRPVTNVVVFQDISQRKQIEEKLRESQRFIQQVADATPGILYIYDLIEQRNVYANRHVGDVLGYTVEAVQAMGDRLFPTLMHPEDLAMQSQQLERFKAAQDHEVIEQEYRMWHANGEWRWLWSRDLVFLRTATGEPHQILGIAQDITERKQTELITAQLYQAEQAARAEAEAANRMKDDFLAVLSHELRTPMNPILGWSRLLQQRKLNANQTAIALETIERNAKLQVQLIEDLLDISRILQGKLSLHPSPVHLATMINAAIETVCLAAEAKKIRFKTQIDASVGYVLGDVTRLQQVMWNLLSNAVKFTPPDGQVEVCLSMYSQVPYQAKITVTDTGKGISPEFLPYIFDTFRQADSSITRFFGGLGLGLAIARHIVELHGGSIHAASAGEGQGATFTVKLPLIPTAVHPASAAAGVDETLSLQGIQILAVDDEIDNLELVTFILEQAGAVVVAAASAQAALQCFDRTKPDILLVDIGMPHTDGYTLLCHIRALETECSDRPIPAIALTAYVSEFDQQQALAAGFQQHIPKPVEPEVLLQTILMEIQRSRLQV